jgi:hypothetical protein
MTNGGLLRLFCAHGPDSYIRSRLFTKLMRNRIGFNATSHPLPLCCIRAYASATTKLRYSYLSKQYVYSTEEISNTCHNDGGNLLRRRLISKHLCKTKVVCRTGVLIIFGEHAMLCPRITVTHNNEGWDQPDDPALQVTGEDPIPTWRR